MSVSKGCSRHNKTPRRKGVENAAASGDPVAWGLGGASCLTATVHRCLLPNSTPKTKTMQQAKSRLDSQLFFRPESWANGPPRGGKTSTATLARSRQCSGGSCGGHELQSGYHPDDPTGSLARAARDWNISHAAPGGRKKQGALKYSMPLDGHDGLSVLAKLEGRPPRTKATTQLAPGSRQDRRQELSAILGVWGLAAQSPMSCTALRLSAKYINLLSAGNLRIASPGGLSLPVAAFDNVYRRS